MITSTQDIIAIVVALLSFLTDVAFVLSFVSKLQLSVNAHTVQPKTSVCLNESNHSGYLEC